MMHSHYHKKEDIPTHSVVSCLPFTSEEGADAQSVLQEATDLLNTKFGFHSITIQVELYSEDMSHCSHCQDPSD